MNKNWFKIFSVMGVVVSWSSKAVADGKVTIHEALELVEELATILGFDTQWDVDTKKPNHTA